MKAFRTIAEQDDTIETLYEIQRSKFITHICHAETEEEARAFVLSIKKDTLMPDTTARHGCWANPQKNKSPTTTANQAEPPAIRCWTR